MTKTFNDGANELNILRDINLTLYAGDQIAIMGSSGSGKSTLLQILGGLDNPTSGEVQLTGQRFDQMNETKRSYFRNRYLGFIYQFHHLLPEFTALENVCMPLWIRGVSRAETKQKASALLERVGLKERFEHKLGELSGGERQRVAIARALVGDPLCVLADEPTGNLDNQTAEQIYALIDELRDALDISFVIVTHDHHLAQRMDKVYQLVDGVLTQQKPS